jgi:hypothetical protein
LVWVDDGNNVWSSLPHVVNVEDLSDEAAPEFAIESLTDSLIYGFKVQATNAIGLSIESNTQYFACATVPEASLNPPVLD